MVSQAPAPPGVQDWRLGKCQLSRNVPDSVACAAIVSLTAKEAVGASASPGARSSSSPSALKSSQKSSSVLLQLSCAQELRQLTPSRAVVVSASVPNCSASGSTPSEESARPWSG